MTEREAFEAALELAPEARAGFIDAASGGDPAMRARLAALLGQHDQAGSFLESPAANLDRTTDQPTPAEAPGTAIGPYKLLEPGEGGFGVVYLAEQAEPVRRKVALKVLKPGMDTRQVVARFEAERQALAIMDHPNIARVFDGGATPSGRPYFVMELVKGTPITEFCDQNHLTPRQRLELFVSVCQAVQHAHQKGIIHRDLKPSNVLVSRHDTTPVVKVIDFGVAKALGQSLTDKTVFTGLAQMVGTPLYMSPEQAGMSDLDVDTRSDIYSLGVLLYELLTGTTPFTKERFRQAAYDEIRRIIREEEPPKPSTRLSDSTASLPSVAAVRQTEPARLTKLVRGELDWIVMKALEKDRSRRYETANGFALDVQRYLAGEAVQAVPPSTVYRLKKFVRRNKGPLLAASLVLLVLVAGVAGTTWGMVEARVARDDAVEQKRLAELAAEEERQAKFREAQRADGEEKAKLQADERRKEAERNLAFARKGNEILGSVFAGLDPKKIAESGRPLQDVLRENLITAVKELEGSAIGDPLVVAEMQNTLGLSLLALGEAALAVEVLQKSLATVNARLAPDDPNTLRCMDNLARGYLAAGKLDLALPLAEETLKRMKAKHGPDHSDTLSSMNNLAACYQDVGRLDLAVPLSEETFNLTKAKHGPDHGDTLSSMGSLALVYKAAGKLDRAVPLFEETLKLRKAKFPPYHPHTLASMNNLALGYLAAGKLDLALPLLEETFRLAKAKHGPDHPLTLTSMDSLAGCYQDALKLDLALPLFEETLKLSKARRGPDHPHTLISMNNLAGCYLAAGKLDLALPLYEETFRLAKAKHGPDHPLTLTSMANLGVFYRDVGKLDLALQLLEENLKLTKAKLGPDHPSTLQSMNNLAMGYKAALKLDLALPLFEETLKLRKAKLGPDHPNTLRSMHELATGYLDARKLDLALPLFEETLKLWKAKLGADHPHTLATMNGLGVCYWTLRQLDKSVPLFEELLPLREKKLGRDHQDTLVTVANLGKNYMDAGRVAQAIPLLEEAYQASKKHASLRWVGTPLLDAYAKAGKPAEAAKLIDELLADARKALPKDSPQLAGQMAQFGSVLLETKQYAAAEPLLRECLAIREKKQPDDWRTFNTQSMLGGSLLSLKKYKDAEPLLLKGYEGMKVREKAIPPQAGTRIPEALDRLIELYTATDRPAEAKKWRAERAKYPELAPPPLEKK